LARNYPGYVILAGVRSSKDAISINDMKIPNLMAILIDVISHESCVDAMNKIEGLMEDLHLPFIALVNNAGIGRSAPVEHHSLDDARKVFDTNFFGVMDLTQLAIPHLKRSQGRIVMVSSAATFASRAMSSVYTASKAALEVLSDCLRRELEPYKISVSIIQPALVKTNIFETSRIASNEMLSMHSSPPESPSSTLVAPNGYEEYFSRTASRRKKMLEAASDPIVTSEAIAHAIANELPKTRYAVANVGGVPASIASWFAWILSDRTEDYLLSMLF
jgi:NAD(P)-dependent dehydrogenase (short-subunit alcohol dehydrogenase family)